MRGAPRTGNSVADRIVNLLISVYPRPMLSPEIAEAIGVKVYVVRKYISLVVKRGAIATAAPTDNPLQNARRTYVMQADNDPFVPAPPPEPKPPRPKQPRKPRGPNKVKAARKAAEPALKIAARGALAGEATNPRGVKPTVIPGFTGDRWQVKPTPFFAALTPGSYLKSDSAVARAYA